MARDEIIHVRVSAEEREAVRSAARRQYMAEGTWVRGVILREIDFEALEPTEFTERRDQYLGDDEGAVEVMAAHQGPTPEAPCGECGHPKGAHLHMEGLPDKCMLCPKSDSLHPHVPIVAPTGSEQPSK